MRDEDFREHYRATLDTLDGLTDDELDALYDHAYEAEELVRAAQRKKELAERRARTLNGAWVLAAKLAEEGEYAREFYARAFDAPAGAWIHAGGGGVWREKPAPKSGKKDAEKTGPLTELESLFVLGQQAAAIDPEGGAGLIDWLDGLLAAPVARRKVLEPVRGVLRACGRADGPPVAYLAVWA